MRFAIVDIETTGGFPEQHGMTEIAIVLHNGTEVEGKYETLINPHQEIPPHTTNTNKKPYKSIIYEAFFIWGTQWGTLYLVQIITNQHY
ncbi:MAG: hypothetical protein HYI21_08445 [Sediminibacterium sp. Gen4]|jgi:hypothetical protein|uniref:exonuclease domain-containing protein n=1 Tax=unclassified Sediminibacterium TaxID=2635961 RepID=UPI0015B89441|nr:MULTISPECIES: exonuclease domain-containing protein [unclassified Sediminibacterium]MBW0162432.1 hypothetical protein [Sediminibacterium sp.]MBW0164639.1 hypothetical protein [Sediminibacterium sp.]MDZ4070777.1 exonuclease domain-containing protein [Sediminibacterium sp.]NWK66042.1 hypothetical protein [Sediminibacterium sp. Gen4]